MALRHLTAGLRLWVAFAIGALLAAAAITSARSGALPDLRDGDLIFQESQSRQSAAILAATGSRFTHMGIARLRRGDVYVVEAAATVRETPLRRWIERGKGGRYAVYRVRNLSADQAAAMLHAAERYYGRPYDILFRPDDDAIYCSELPRLAFASVGIELGREQRLGDLHIDDKVVAQPLAERWRRHPRCAGLASAEACRAAIQDQPIVTPATIAEDADVELIHSTF